MPPADRKDREVVVALFCAFLLISNVAATKLIEFGPRLSVGGAQILPIIVDGGAILFPLTYVLSDVLAEVYGFAQARRAILLGLVCSAAAAGVFLLVDIAPPAAGWPNQDAWHAVLGFVPRIVAASLLAYLTGQLLNAWTLVAMKRATRGRALWARLLGSTVVGEAADTLVFCVVAFAGVVSTAELVNYILVGYLYKVGLEVVLLPITYRVIALLRRRAGEPG